MHWHVVKDLKTEGDAQAGAYRSHDVAISASKHTPPPAPDVHSRMSDLLEFANRQFPNHQQLLQIALVHHRFAWIHPFGNGNGRVARLLTYAMLRNTVFSGRGHSAFNPTSVFGNDRSAYITALKNADDLGAGGSVEWAAFFARGIRDDLERIANLQKHEYVLEQLIGPAVSAMFEDEVVSRQTADVLLLMADRGVVKAGDLMPVIGGSSSDRSRVVRDLLERDLIRRAEDGPRFYQLRISGGPLAMRLVGQLGNIGALPPILAGD